MISNNICEAGGSSGLLFSIHILIIFILRVIRAMYIWYRDRQINQRKRIVQKKPLTYSETRYKTAVA